MRSPELDTQQVIDLPGWEQLRTAALALTGARGVTFVSPDAERSSLERTTWLPAPSEAQPAAGQLAVPVFALQQRFGQLIIEFGHGPPQQANAINDLELLCCQLAADECCRRQQLELEREQLELERQQSLLAARRDMLDATERVGRTGSFRWRPADGQQQWTRMNCVLHGYQADVPEPTFDMCARRLHPEDRDRFMAIVDDGVRAGREINVEYRLVMPDGKVRDVLARAKPYIAGEWIGSLIDVTELRATEDALRATRMALSRVSSVTTMGELAAAIAHELNQPLTSMIANAGAALRWLRREPPNQQRVTSSLDSIVRDARRAGEIIRAMHALTSQSAPTFGPVSVDDVIGDIVALMRPELSRQRIQLEVNLLSKRPVVTGDKGQLRQVVLNLVSNAAEAMASIDGRPRVLGISTRDLDGGRMEVAVTDTGIGLDAQSVDKLFEAFYSTKSAGMGMGLAICRSIMNQHRGTLEGRNREPCGSEFRATLPLAV